MKKNLLIVGAGSYGLVAKDIAENIGCFCRIAFVDDNKNETSDGIEIIGKLSDVDNLIQDFSDIIVAIGNSRIRIDLIKKYSLSAKYNIAKLISPRAYVSPSTQIGKGCIIEPMVVVNAKCKIEDGCIISAGAVLNHDSTCCEGVHVDCNATVDCYCEVPRLTKVKSGEVFSKIRL